jgi:putative addiction module component (TIGR02574 family)
MRVNDIPEIARLSTPEKILLVEALWDDISSDESIIAAPVSHKKELEKRLKKYGADPGTLLSLEDLQTRVGKRKWRDC